MSISDIIKLVNDLVGDVNFIPYNMAEVQLMVGAPPVPITGVEYVFADHFQQQSKLFMGLNAKGVFVQNTNQSGVIEFGLLDGVVSGGAIQLMDLTGIPLPILVTDGTTNSTSTATGSKCKLIKTPAWRRERLPGINIFTFHVERLLISTGVRAAED